MYNYEKELQFEFVNILRYRCSSDEIILEEFDARFGNVDVVKVSKQKDLFLDKNQIEILSNIACAKVAGLLHKHSIRTFSYLKSKTQYDRKYLYYILNSLIKASIVIEISKERYLINEKFKFPKITFNAYELKLENWKKAILQANANKKFASYSWIVMPNEICQSIIKKNLSIFKSFNIGLIGVKKNRLTVYNRPLKEKDFVTSIEISSIAKYFKKVNI